MSLLWVRRTLLALCIFVPGIAAASPPQGSAEAPIRVILVPADGGTADGTITDFRPLFEAVSQMTGLRFDLRTGQDYAGVIEGICAGHADIAWFGPASFLEAQERGCAELLAVDVRDGKSTYHAAIFVRSDSPARSVGDLRGRRIALGSVHSASSFLYPVEMLLDAGVDPRRDLDAVYLTGSHSAALMALDAGRADAAGASVHSFLKAVDSGAIDPARLRVLALSRPIPNPPLAFRPGLDPKVKATIRQALASVHTAPGVAPGMIRGYGGKSVDRYDTRVDPAIFSETATFAARIDDDFKAAILKRSARPD